MNIVRQIGWVLKWLLVVICGSYLMLMMVFGATLTVLGFPVILALILFDIRCSVLKQGDTVKEVLNDNAFDWAVCSAWNSLGILGRHFERTLEFLGRLLFGWVAPIVEYLLMIDNIFASLIAGTIIAVFSFVGGFAFRKRQFKKRYETAIEQFSNDLGKVIIADSVATSPTVQARTIVTIRDSGRKQLSSLESTLNSEIDELARLLRERKKAEDEGIEVPDLNSQRIDETLEVLRNRWPAKKTEIDVAVRRVFAEFGLKEI